ncbi:hypothetical protein MKY95_07685 [Paenibacillus sp. FSL P4-0176]|uniref:hypothetical protein n=1 Tax=Paenibacillus sp. FSL P4-0176 TaxID=2921631 RepID=UPI0030D436F5
MKKMVFTMNEENIFEVLGVENSEGLNKLREKLSPHDVSLSDFISTLTNLISV